MTNYEINDELRFWILRSIKVGALTFGYTLGGVGLVTDVVSTLILAYHMYKFPHPPHWSLNDEEVIEELERRSLFNLIHFKLDWNENSLPPITTIIFYLDALIGAIIGSIFGVLIGLTSLILKSLKPVETDSLNHEPAPNIGKFVPNNRFFTEQMPPISNNKTLSQMGII